MIKLKKVAILSALMAVIVGGEVFLANRMETVSGHVIVALNAYEKATKGDPEDFEAIDDVAKQYAVYWLLQDALVKKGHLESSLNETGRAMRAISSLRGYELLRYLTSLEPGHRLNENEELAEIYHRCSKQVGYFDDRGRATLTMMIIFQAAFGADNVGSKCTLSKGVV